MGIRVSSSLLLIVALAACGSQDASAPSPAAPASPAPAGAGIRGEGLSDITLPEPLFRNCKDREDIVEATRCMWHRYREAGNGKKQQRNRWRNAHSAVQCDGGMSVEKAERRVRMGTNARLWQRVVEAIRACDATTAPSAGFLPFTHGGSTTSLQLMGGGDSLVAKNASVGITGSHTATLVEGGYIEDLNTGIVVELPGTEPDPGQFRVTLSGLDTLLGMGDPEGLGLQIDSSSNVCSSEYTACANDANCFCVDSESGQSSTLGLTGQVHRAAFNIEIWGSPIDDHFVSPEGTHSANISITDVNGTTIADSGSSSISLTVEEDDIVTAFLETERIGTRGENGGPHIRVVARINRPVVGGWNLRGNFEGIRGDGGSWAIQPPADGPGFGNFRTGPENGGKWEKDCSRNPGFDGVEFEPQGEGFNLDNFRIRYGNGTGGPKICQNQE